MDEWISENREFRGIRKFITSSFYTFSKSSLNDTLNSCKLRYNRINDNSMISIISYSGKEEENFCSL